MPENWTGGASSAWWAMPEQLPDPEAAPPASPLGSLVSRRAIYTRNGVAWLSVRAWSHKARQHDIAVMRAAKRALDPQVIAGAADELAHFAGLCLGPLPGWLVSTVAVGHSRRPDSFAVRLAEGVAERLGMPFEKIFADRFVEGVSHPKEFSKLPPLERLAEPNRPVLLIDDVATSGWHIEEALTDIRRAGVPALALAWISGTVK
ncbi:hypothetical protein MesoLjLc_45530 [Mesorhizobium sp. L-8-10]|uniref:phosphoribosyltransferase n=1 Tax=Mesorhizobium sp. L-8-10 TaxID=2744523 RepID=UPI0019293AC1|nr:phosphoribosyltransferase [Mesorhizobium sp. L-8-10]BCH32623.1 hypothetical protein MesoLjLc_45530 [Mesorhizobium sp. L-8-10]